MKHDFQNNPAGTEDLSSSSLLGACGRLLAHLVSMHFWTMVGSPKYSAMKDSFDTFMLYMVIACATAMSCVFVGASSYPDTAGGFSQTFRLIWIAFGPIALMALVDGRTRSPNHLWAVLLACSTVVDLMYLVANFLGYVSEPVQVSSWLFKAFLGFLAIIAFRRAPTEVQQRGYGMRAGEF